MKNKLFWIVVVFAVPAICLFLIGIRAEDKAPWLMASFTDLVALFTFLLWRATKEYTEVTKKLLEQSKQALTTNVFREILFSTSQLNVQLRISGFEKKARPPYVENFAIGMLAMLQSTDPSLFKKISEAIENWCKTDNKFPAITYLKALNKIKEYQKIEEKELIQYAK